MTPDEISRQLNGIADADDFNSRSEQLVEAWTAAGIGVETVTPILRFMEDHPAVDFGLPGSLVHFVERFSLEEYEPLLVASIQRKPTAHTAWMLNRVINGTKEPTRRRRIIAVMRQARKNPLADGSTVKSLDNFLDGLE